MLSRVARKQAAVIIRILVVAPKLLVESHVADVIVVVVADVVHVGSLDDCDGQ